MTLKHIPLEQLHPAKTNVRKFQSKQIDDLVPSISRLGLLQPLLVRLANDDSADNSYEVIAGQRRYHALCKISEGKNPDPVPCLIMNDDDDAIAIEASLSENIDRLPMDEIDQYKAFTALQKTGLDVEEIASRFGVTERLVRQRLAIAKLYSPILTAYRKEEIEPSTIRTLTMASRVKQKKWWALYRSEDEYAPTGRNLKRWLLGGGDIRVSHALFALKEYDGALVSDLFGDDQYFDSAEKFWCLQNIAIAETKERYLKDGWQEVVILDVGTWWYEWGHTETSIEDGGKVFVQIAADGEVQFHEGYLTAKEAERRKNGDRKKPARPEITKAMQNYLSLHRHAAVKYKLLDNHGLALRVATAQIIARSSLWSVSADPQKAVNDKIAESLQSNQSEQDFKKHREAIRDLLGLEGEGHIVPTKQDWTVSHYLPEIFAKLLTLDDEAVTCIFTFIVAETLSSGDVLIEILGHHLDADLSEIHKPDDVFFDLLRDKQVINGMIAEVSGANKAASHVSDTAKEQKSLLKNLIKAKQPDWTPRYFRFPMKAYTERGGISMMNAWTEVQSLFE